MKIKSIIVALGLIITMISGVGLNNSNKPTNDVEMQNTVAVEENVANEENIISEAEQEEITQEQTPNNEVEETKEVKQEVKTETQKETPKTTNKATTNTKPKTVAPSVQETTPKSESKAESVVETPKKEETPAPQVQKTLTPDDLEYWCVSGGSHHIAGDRANEHGYYSSWDEAHQAFENYTKGWASVQYKISQCSCGLFYFWAIQ